MDELIKEANAFDYINWRGDLSFRASFVNKIDMAILTQVAILNLKDIVPSFKSDDAISFSDAYDKFLKEGRGGQKIGLIIPPSIIRLFNKAHKSNRFKDILLMHYLEDISLEDEMQISATTFKISESDYIICFSGTDDTIVGWKENFNMIHTFPVPAQIKACEYVEEIIKRHSDGTFYICGHSKGGNMALYSTYAVSDDAFKRINHTYNFDGPGLSCKDDDFIKIVRTKKITSVFPVSSVVGVLFDHSEKITYVKSNQNGAYQHDVLSWIVKGNDFVYEKSLSKESLALSVKTKAIIDQMTEEEKVKFSNNLYKVLSAGDSYNLLSANEQKRKIWDAYFKLSKEDKKYISDPIHKLLKDRDIQKSIFNTIKGMFIDNINNNKIKKIEKDEKKES